MVWKTLVAQQRTNKIYNGLDNCMGKLPPNSALNITILSYTVHGNTEFLRQLYKAVNAQLRGVRKRTKPKIPANQWNTLDISAEFPASTSADILLSKSRDMKFGPDFEAKNSQQKQI